MDKKLESLKSSYFYDNLHRAITAYCVFSVDTIVVKRDGTHTYLSDMPIQENCTTVGELVLKENGARYYLTEKDVKKHGQGFFDMSYSNYKRDANNNYPRHHETGVPLALIYGLQKGDDDDRTNT